MHSVIISDFHDPLYLNHELLNVCCNHLSSVIDHFSKVWSKECLSSLKEKQVGNQSTSQPIPIKVVDVVLVATETTCRWQHDYKGW